jgi:Ca-activated chloride channel family protein
MAGLFALELSRGRLSIKVEPVMPPDLNFGSAPWLWGLAAVPVLVVLFCRAERQSTRRLIALLPAPRLRAQLIGAASVARRRWRYAFLLLALAGLLVTLAQPRWGYETRQTHRRGLDVIVVVDVSRSMLATDVAPSRLARAKLALHDLVLELNGDRLGLVAFAGSAFLQAPLTIDYDAVLRAADELDTELIPMGGTNIGAGLNLALEAFGKAEAGNRAIILLSDGEPTADSDQADGVQAASRAAEDGVKVFTLGFGTPEGSLIPLGGANTGELVRDEQGQLVRTRLNQSGLQEIAHAGGGFYVHFENGGASLQTVVQNGLSRLKTAEIDARTSRRPIERYQWPLGMGLAALSLGTLLGERRKSRAPAALAVAGRGRRQPTAAALAWAAAGLGIGIGLGGGAGGPARAADAPGQAQSSALDLYRDGRYDQAYNAFEDLARQHPKIGNLQFDAGASAYMARQYDEALDAFAKALTSNDPALQAKSHYNFGNALYRRGEQQKDSKEKISDWRDAIQHYDTVLNALKSQQPSPAGDTLASDTAYNRDVVQRRLDQELKKSPQPLPQPKQGKPDRQQNNQPNQQNSPDPQRPPQGGKQDKQDQQPSSSQGPPQPGNGNQHGQPDQQDQSGQSGTRPDAASVPNQDKPRQRGDFKAQPANAASETPKDQGPPPPDAAEENGKMTPDQARALLQSLKDEDTTVNLNDDPDSRARRDEPVIKDW